MTSYVKRLCVMACAVACMLSVGTTLASAAGKPTSVAISNTHEVNGYTVIEITAKLNPNGTTTTALIEYREDGASEKVPWIEASIHKLSGTTLRTYSEEIQIDPVKDYEFRLKATNLFGATVTPIVHGISTHIRTTGEEELTNVPFGSQGVATFAFVYLSMPITVVCNEFASGRIGNPGGVEDIYKYSMSGCVTYMEGEESPECKVKDFTFTLSGPTLSVSSPGFIPLEPKTETCTLEQYWQVNANPFRVVDNGNAEYSNMRSVSVTAEGSLFGGNPAAVVIESEWFLTGALINTPFKFVTLGL